MAWREEFLAKIAAELERALAQRSLNGTGGRAVERRVAQGQGWTVSDVVCTCDRRDRTFEERHKGFSIALVAAGSFQYRSSIGRSHNRPGAHSELMTPGSILFGNPGQTYECGHEHGAGDRCISFWYSPDHFERLAVSAGAPAGKLQFRRLRLPPLRELSPVVAQACCGVSADGSAQKPEISWEELSLRLAVLTLRLLGKDGSLPDANNAQPSSV